MLPARDAIIGSLRRELYEPWRARHKSVRGEHTAKGSLAGLILLQQCLPDVALAYDSDGRPYAEGRAVDFNLTHTADYTFLAFTREEHPPARIGIDAEDLSRIASVRICPMAERWFSAGEYRAFLNDPTDCSFLRIWTRKEALVKWTGRGLGGLRDADTTRAEITHGVRFYEYREGSTLVTLCTDSPTEPPLGIQMLSRADLLAMGLSSVED
jgi:phosphopantetheinyl transferase